MQALSSAFSFVKSLVSFPASTTSLSTEKTDEVSQKALDEAEWVDLGAKKTDKKGNPANTWVVINSAKSAVKDKSTTPEIQTQAAEKLTQDASQNIVEPPFVPPEHPLVLAPSLLSSLRKSKLDETPNLRTIERLMFATDDASKSPNIQKPYRKCKQVYPSLKQNKKKPFQKPMAPSIKR